MPSFRDNLLTWLFFIAAGCVTAVDLTQNDQQLFAALILTGMVYIAGAWAAVGKANRLARGAAMFIVPFAVALPFFYMSPRPDESQAVLAMALIAVVFSYAAAMATRLSLKPWTATSASVQRWQISLSEILGWTVVTAIASVAVSKARIPPGMEWDSVWIVGPSVLPCGVMTALFLVPRPRRDLAATIQSAMSVVGSYIVFGLMQNVNVRYVEHLGVGAQLLGFIGLWIFCMRLDEHAIAQKAACDQQTPLKIHDEPSLDDSSHDE